MALYLSGSPEVTAATEYISTMLGAPIINVELAAQNYTTAFNTSIEEYSHYITQWAIKSNIANALGLPSATDFTQRWVASIYEFGKQYARAYSEQLNVGGTVPIRKDYITLVDGKQVYYLPDDIVLNDVMWQEPPAINRYLIDPNNNPAWVNYEFGWGYMGYSYKFIVPVSFSIQLANATEMRMRTLRGDFTYAVRPAGEDAARVAPDVTGRTRNALHIYPVPTDSMHGARVWYFYKEIDDLNKYSGLSAGEVVNNPGTINMDEIPYSAFNSAGQRWVRNYSLAVAKEMLGRVRSKFAELPIPDATITLDGEALVAEGKEAQEQLKEYLHTELEAMDPYKLLEDSANAAENLNKQLSFTPGGIYIM